MLGNVISLIHSRAFFLGIFIGFVMSTGLCCHMVVMLLAEVPVPTQTICERVDNYVDTIEQYAQTVDKQTNKLMPLVRQYTGAAHRFNSTDNLVYLASQQTESRHSVRAHDCNNPSIFERYIQALNRPIKSRETISLTKQYSQAIHDYSERLVAVLDKKSLRGGAFNESSILLMVHFEAGLCRVRDTNRGIIAEIRRFEAERGALGEMCAEETMTVVEVVRQLIRNIGPVVRLKDVADSFASGITATKDLDVLLSWA